MANRNKSYNEVLAQKFNNKKYARAYFINLVEKEGLSIERAIQESIKAMGLSLFAKKSGLSVQAVSDFVAGRTQWSSDKIAKHTKAVFGIKVKLALDVA